MTESLWGSKHDEYPHCPKFGEVVIYGLVFSDETLMLATSCIAWAYASKSEKPSREMRGAGMSEDSPDKRLEIVRGVARSSCI